mgnify:FL=1
MAALRGNWKRQGIPQWKNLRLKKLLILKEEDYKTIEKWKEKNKFFKLKIKLKKQKKAEIRKKVILTKPKSNISSLYESSNISNTQNSDYWRWRRVKEWFNMLKDYNR